MAIALDSANNGAQAAGATSVSWSHTCGAGTTLLLVLVGAVDATLADRTISGVTYNGSALTDSGVDCDYGPNGFRTEIWYKINPTTGSALTIQVTAGGKCTDLAGCSLSVSGTDTTDPIGGSITEASISSAPTVLISNCVDTSWMVGVLITDESDNTLVTPNYTQIGEQDVGADVFNAQRRTALTGNTTLSWGTSSSAYVISAIEILAGTAGVEVNCTTDALVLTENAAAVKVDRNVNTVLEQLTITTFDAVVTLSVNVQATTASLTCTPNAATVKVDTDVQAGYDALSITSYGAAIKADISIQANTDALDITTYAAGVELPVTVATDTAALALTTQAATVNAALNIAASTDTLAITENAADVNLNVSISATTDALSLTGNTATINAGINISAGTGALQVATHQSSISIDINILAQAAALVVNEGPANINAETNIQAGMFALVLSENIAGINFATGVLAGFDALNLATYKADVQFIAGNVIISFTEAETGDEYYLIDDRFISKEGGGRKVSFSSLPAIMFEAETGDPFLVLNQNIVTHMRGIPDEY